MQEVDVEISLSYPHSGEGKWAELRVEDRASGQIIVRLRLEPAELMDLMSTTSVWPGAKSLMTDHPERFGKMHVHQSYPYAGERLVYSKSKEMVQAYANQLLEDKKDEGWEVAGTLNTNTGWYVILSKWV